MSSRRGVLLGAASLALLPTAAANVTPDSMADTIRAVVHAPKTAKKGELVEIKAIILHPMETGYRVGTNGRMIPRNIIERFTAAWNGEEIFDMTFSPAIAANPFVTFFAAATASGKIVLRWTGDNDFAVEHSIDVDVA